MIRHLSIFAALLVLLAGCASQTPYQPADKPGAEGYTETPLAQNRYRITFAGNSVTPAETVKNYALLRAGELTLQKGYDWFVLASRDNDKKVQGATTLGTGLGFPPQTEVFQRCGLLSCSTSVVSSPGFGSDFDVVTTTAEASYSSSLEIVMGRKPMPNSAQSYDARELVASLRALMNKQK